MISTLPLFRPLNDKLLELLESLSREDWQRPTLAREWTVKDITAHLLDGSIRAISLYRDHWQLSAPTLSGYNDIVRYLNQINAEWVVSMRRVSPRQLVEWHRQSHEEYIRCFESLDPTGPAMYAVSWAGDTESPNWFHIAREYTEKWHHQQQIREAVGRQGILTPELYRPVLETFLRALPHRYRDTDAPVGTNVEVAIVGASGGAWRIRRGPGAWELVHSSGPATVRIEIPQDLAWKLFTNAMRGENARSQVKITGEERLGLPVLSLIAVMA